jgi:hypothetical protein
MGWMILIAVVVLLLIGFARGFNSEATMNRSDSDERSENADDQMLEDWYTSQELDNDLDDWDR